MMEAMEMENQFLIAQNDELSHFHEMSELTTILSI